MSLPKFGVKHKPTDRFQATLHDLTNALAASRSFAEVIQLHAQKGTTPDAAEAAGLLDELDRAGEMIRAIRLEMYQPGDVLKCEECGYTFVFRKASAASASCRRCKTNRIVRWNASADEA